MSVFVPWSYCCFQMRRSES